jgi:hypothetical protein
MLAAFGRLVMLCGLALTGSACATIISGTTQDLYVDSEPKGAACKVDRQGATVGMINPTPGKATVPRHKDNIVVSCALDGYDQSNEVIASSFSGATFGNLLLGGFVGVVIDASSGANNKYPERIVVIMTPSAFPNDAARDAYYAGLKARLDDAANAEIKRINDSCSSTGRELCTIEAKQIREARDKAVLAIDQKRLAAKVAPAN